ADSGWSIAAKNVSIARSSTTDPNSVSDWAVQSDAGNPGSGVFAGCDGGGGGTPPSDTELQNGVAKTSLTASSGNKLNYTIDIPSGSSNLVFSISGGSGDADLYTSFGSAPTTSSYDCRPYLSGNSETCTVSTPETGIYYIMLNAYSTFSGMSLTASFDTSTGGGGGTTPPAGTDDPAGYSYNSYYANATGQTGNNLKSALNGIIQQGHTKLSYTPGVWDALSFTDEDPNNSSNVLLIYKGNSINKATRAGQSSSQDAWNREHVWAKSHGFPSSGQWAYTDIHHLRPSDVSINSSRGNKDFDNGGTAISEAPENRTDSDSFEPRDEVKGDVARMVFYMDVRYEGSDSSGTPDLEIADYVGTGSQALLGKLCTLVAWHRADNVSAQEVRRNGRIHQVQGNRNPFIDNPDWVETLYGDSCP
ncbi:MAG: endonuclease, partial [Algicola sp.]|nr:endonuclease [Algicola sp.]